MIPMLLLKKQVEEHPYRLIFATTISGRTCMASRRRIPTSIYAAFTCCRSTRSSVSVPARRPSRGLAFTMASKSTW